jgi:hypothetical protein
MSNAGPSFYLILPKPLPYNNIKHLYIKLINEFFRKKFVAVEALQQRQAYIDADPLALI